MRTTGAAPRQAPALSPNGHGPPTPARRRLPLAAVGVLAAVAGALAAAALFSSVGQRQEVLAVARPVAVGAPIQAADLAVAEVSASQALRPLPASARAGVIGRPAAVGLVPGTLLTKESVAHGRALAPGQALVGLALKPGRFPLGIAKGQGVLVVIGEADAVDAVHRAVVVEVDEEQAEGERVVSVLLPEASAAAVAVAAADDRVSLARVT